MSGLGYKCELCGKEIQSNESHRSIRGPRKEVKFVRSVSGKMGCRVVWSGPVTYTHDKCSVANLLGVKIDDIEVFDDDSKKWV